MKLLRYMLLLMPLWLTACGPERDGQRLDIKAERGTGLYSDTLDLYLYGATRITRYPLVAGDRLRVDYDRDTTDFFLLSDPLDGRIILPIVPDSVDVAVRIGGELTLNGIPRDFTYREWYALNLRDTVSSELIDFLAANREGTASSLFGLASYQKFGDDPELRDFAEGGLMANGSLLSALGINTSIFRERDRFIYRFGTSRKPKRLAEVMGKDTMMVVSVLPPEFVSDRDTAFLLALDTLSQQRYFILPGTDSLPSSWRKILEKSEKKNHATPDSSFMATRLAAEMNLSRMPVYMVVDSLAKVLYKTEERDSLLALLLEADEKGSKTLLFPDKGQRRTPARRPLLPNRIKRR